MPSDSPFFKWLTNPVLIKIFPWLANTEISTERFWRMETLAFTRDLRVKDKIDEVINLILTIYASDIGLIKEKERVRVNTGGIVPNYYTEPYQPLRSPSYSYRFIVGSENSINTISSIPETDQALYDPGLNQHF